MVSFKWHGDTKISSKLDVFSDESSQLIIRTMIVQKI